MAKGSQGELNALRKRVSAYVKALIRLGLAAQTLSSSGGSHLAISRLISSGISIAGQLQRGIIVRVVGAPLVRRRPRGRRGTSVSEEFLEPAPSPLGPEARDREATEWEDVLPQSLSSAELDGQPFSLARALPSIVAGQQSTFRALSSVNAAVARVIAGTAFGSASSRAPPSQTSLETGQRTSPDSFPEDQATAFAGDRPALSVSAAFMGAASSMAFNLSSAAHETTSIALGSQTVGASFASQPPRTPNEGTAFAPSSQPTTSPSLLQQSVTGVVDTSLKTPPPAGANLGLPGSAGGASPTPGGASPSASSELAVTRETPAPASLSAEVGGASSGASSATSSSSPAAGHSVDLNAGPYTVPNGFNSVLSTPAVSAASQLSMQIRSLGASGPSGQLPMRASQEPSTEEGPSLGMSVVPDQYPSSYPAGVAYSMSGIVASLGLAESAPSSAERARAGQAVSAEEALGVQDAGATAAGSQVGEPLGARGPEALETSLSYEAAEPGYPSGDQASSPPQLFGERWIGSLAAAAGMGGALMDLLTLVGASPSSGSWTPVVASAGSLVSQAQASPYARAVSASAAGAAGGGLASGREVSGADSLPPGSTPLPNQAAAPAEIQRGTVWGEPKQLGPAITVSAGLPLAASAREPSDFDEGATRAGVSVWEVVTLLPGILTPFPDFRPSGEASRSSASHFTRLEESVGAGSEEARAGQLDSRARIDSRLLSEGSLVTRAVGAAGAIFDQPPADQTPSRAVPAALKPSDEASLLSANPFKPHPTEAVRGRFERAPASQDTSRVGLDALRLAASLRAIVLSASAATLGAGAALLSTSAAEASPPREGAPELGFLTPGAQGTFVRQGASGQARSLDFGFSREASGEVSIQETPQATSFSATRLVALQATFASRSLFAAGAAGPGAIASSLAGEAPSAERPSSPARSLAQQSARPMGTSSPPAPLPRGEPLTGAVTQPSEPDLAPLDGYGPPAYERELEAARSSLSREGRTSAEGVFFGLAAVSEALSLAAKLPSAAQLNGSLAAIPRATGIRPAGARPTRQTVKDTAGAELAVEASPRMTEGWRSAPEEALARMLKEEAGTAHFAGQEGPQEADDRELRRKIGKMIDEELRRHGYQT